MTSGPFKQYAEKYVLWVCFSTKQIEIEKVVNIY